MGLFIKDLTYERCNELIDENTVIVLPIGGAVKEHGNHLPMGTDYFVTDYLASELTKRCNVLTLPTVPYAYFPAFIEWKGSVNIQYQNFINYIKDILLSYVKFGVKKFLIIDGGVSTFIPLKLLSLTMNNEHNVKVAISSCEGLGLEVENDICEQKMGGHGDEAETSMMLYLREDLVNMNKTTEEYREVLMDGINVNGVMKIYFPTRMNTPTGTNGNSTMASKEKGEKLINASVNDLVNFVEEYLKWEFKKC